MIKKLFLLAGLLLAFGTIVSAEMPIPPCDPKCKHAPKTP
jgi:hypothetical protein